MKKVRDNLNETPKKGTQGSSVLQLKMFNLSSCCLHNMNIK